LQLLIVQSHQSGILEDIERHLMQRSTQFADLRVADVMIPRLDIVALDIARPPDDVLDQAAHTIHTRLPAYEETLDHIVLSLLWEWQVDRIAPDRFDLMGACVALIGVAIMIYWPRV